MLFKLVKRTVTTPFGTEMVVEKKYNLFKDQWQNRLWVFQPQDPVFLKLNSVMVTKGVWQ